MTYTVTEQHIIEFLKENLRIEIDVSDEPGNYGGGTSINVSVNLFFGEELIDNTSSSTYICFD